MSKCQCEHWQTCQTCYPQGFDDEGNRIPAKPYKHRDELLDENARLRTLIRDVAIPALEKAHIIGGQQMVDNALAKLKEVV